MRDSELTLEFLELNKLPGFRPDSEKGPSGLHIAMSVIDAVIEFQTPLLAWNLSSFLHLKPRKTCLVCQTQGNLGKSIYSSEIVRTLINGPISVKRLVAHLRRITALLAPAATGSSFHL
jgi:hypothetical protein